jgi:hypothetical protein
MEAEGVLPWAAPEGAAAAAVLEGVLLLALQISLAAMAALAATAAPAVLERAAQMWQPLLLPREVGAALAVMEVPAEMLPPMPVREERALAVMAAMLPLSMSATSPHRAMALMGFLPLVLAEPEPVVVAAKGVLQSAVPGALAAPAVTEVMPRPRLLQPGATAATAATAHLATAVTEVPAAMPMPRLAPLAVVVVGVAPEGAAGVLRPTAVRQAQALGARAATLPSPIKVTSPHRAMARTGSLPAALAEPEPVVVAGKGVLQSAAPGALEPQGVAEAMPRPRLLPQAVMEEQAATGVARAMAALAVIAALRLQPPLPQRVLEAQEAPGALGAAPLPMAEQEVQAPAALAATPLSSVKASSPRRVMALMGFLPPVLAGPEPVEMAA